MRSGLRLTSMVRRTEVPGISKILRVSFNSGPVYCTVHEQRFPPANHESYDVTLPQELAAGGYLVRHEVRLFLSMYLRHIHYYR